MVSARDPNQVDRLRNIIAAPDPETDPTRPRKNVMRTRAAIAHQRVPIRPADKTIEQPVSVEMAAFLSVEKEAYSAKAMNPRSYPGQFVHRFFNGADGSQTRRMKKRRRAEQHRIENLRRAGNGRQPFQPADREEENHASPSSIGARSATDGPFKTLPRASKREPWQGQSQVVSVRFQCTIHFKCGQIAVISWNVPSSSR